MLHVISAQCVARDLHTIAPRTLQHTCWRRFAAQWGDCSKSRIAPFNAIIIIIIIIIIIKWHLKLLLSMWLYYHYYNYYYQRPRSKHTFLIHLQTASGYQYLLLWNQHPILNGTGNARNKGQSCCQNQKSLFLASSPEMRLLSTCLALQV